MQRLANEAGSYICSFLFFFFSFFFAFYGMFIHIAHYAKLAYETMPKKRKKKENSVSVYFIISSEFNMKFHRFFLSAAAS